MAPRARPFSVVVVVLVALSAVLAHYPGYYGYHSYYPRRVFLNYPDMYRVKSSSLYKPKYYHHHPTYSHPVHSSPPVFCPYPTGGSGSPGFAGLVPKLLNDTYDLMHNLLGTLGGSDAALRELGLGPSVLTSVDTLLKQLLVFKQYPCDGGNQGLVPDLLDVVYKLLSSLLSSKGGSGGALGGALGELGLLPELLDSLNDLLQKLLSSNPAAGALPGSPGTVPQLLDVLDNLLRELLTSQQARCNPPGCIPLSAARPTLQYKYCYSKYRGFYLCLYQPHAPAIQAAPAPAAGSPGVISLAPELLTDMYNLMHELIGALRGNAALCEKLGVVPSLLNLIDNLLEQLLVSEKYTCDSDQGALPDALNALSKLLSSLLSSKGAGDEGVLGGLGDVGLLPKILDSLAELLENLLSSRPGAGGSPGGAPGAVQELLNALDTLLKELLVSKSAQCPGAPHSYSYGATRYHIMPKPADPPAPVSPAAPTDVVGILITLLKELIAAKAASGHPIDEGVVPKILDALSTFLTQLIGSHGTAPSGDIPDLLNEMCDVVEKLLASRSAPGGSPGLVPGLLNALNDLLQKVLASKPPPGPGGQTGALPQGLDAVADFLKSLLAS